MAKGEPTHMISDVDALDTRSGISAIVLAAGLSKRMGEPKQLLRAGRSTLLETALHTVRQSRADEIILVLGFAAEEIQQSISTRGTKVVVNEGYTEGMGSSLRAGISAVDPQARAAIVMLADQPFVLPATLDRLIQHHCDVRAQIVIPTYKGFRGNPVLLDRSVFPEIASLKGDIGCRAIFGQHTENIAKLPVDDLGILLDVDTREDFLRLATTGYHAATLALAQPDIETRSSQLQTPAPVAQPELVVVGRDPVALSLLKLGSMLGFTPTLVDPLLPLGDAPGADRILHVLDFSVLPKSPPRSVVVASRGQFDEEAIEQAVRSGAAYVGLLANKNRAQELRETLRKKGISSTDLTRLHAPAGLDIGAESPEEIALSIMAEIVSERRVR